MWDSNPHVLSLVSARMTTWLIRQNDHMANRRESAIVLEMPELDIVLDEHRWALDPSRPWGMPAHLTLLYPFVSPAQAGGDTLARLDEAVADIQAFDATFGSVRWFADRVAWLAPSDPTPFTQLIQRLTDAFPECPPYGGAFGDAVPHVTIGEGKEVHLLQAAVDEIRPHLPLTVRVASISLMQGSTELGSWHTVERIDLAAR
jgi:2'-5' RNA ligase